MGSGGVREGMKKGVRERERRKRGGKGRVREGRKREGWEGGRERESKKERVSANEVESSFT